MVGYMKHKRNSFIEQLYSKEFHRLYKIAFHKVQNSELAQDLVQQTFLAAVRCQDKLAAHPAPGAWLTVTLINLIKNELRLASHDDIPLEEAAKIPVMPTESSFGDLLPVQLSDAEKQILLWRFAEQASYDEMSERLGISAAACRKRVSQALNKCRKYLKEPP